MTASTTTRLARRIAGSLLATVLGVGVAVATGGAAHADIISDIVGGTTVGGSTGPGYYSPAQFYVQATCVGTTNAVNAAVVASPRTGSGGQWFGVQVYAQAYPNGSWTNYGWKQTYVAETHAASGSYSMSDYGLVLSRGLFTGYNNASYRVYVEGYVWNGTAWASLGGKYANHFTVWGATETNAYGQAIQGMPGTSSGYCTVL